MKTTEPINLLLIEDEAFDVRRVRNTLQPFAERLRIVDVVSDGREAVELIEKNRGAYDVVIMDFQIPGALIGENLIRRIKELEPALQIIVITKMTINVTDFMFANNLLEAGAMWYCTKYPGDIEAFIYQPTDFVLNIINAYDKKNCCSSSNCPPSVCKTIFRTCSIANALSAPLRPCNGCVNTSSALRTRMPPF